MVTEKDWQEFTELAHRLRDAQKAYFANRNKLNLALAMELEKKFDKHLEQLAPKVDRQKSIWTENEPWIKERDTQSFPND